MTDSISSGWRPLKSSKEKDDKNEEELSLSRLELVEKRMDDLEKRLSAIENRKFLWRSFFTKRLH